MIYLNENNKVVINEIETGIEATDEVIELITLQTENIKLDYVNGVFHYRSSVNYALNELRIVREAKIAETDFLFLSDNSYLTTTSQKTELKTMRKSLRDATEGLTDIKQILLKIKEL